MCPMQQEVTKIMAPIRDPDHFRTLFDAGAREFYFGWVPGEWLEKYGSAYHLDKLSLPQANLQSLRDVATLVREGHKCGASMHLTVNSHFYGIEDYDIIIPYAKKMADLGVDTFIVCDLALAQTLVELDLGVQICTSGGSVIMNDWGVEYLQKIGVTRVLFQRDTLVREVVEMKRHNPDIQVEVFASGTRCFFIDGLCTGIHHEHTPIASLSELEAMAKVPPPKIDFVNTSMHRPILNVPGFCAYVTMDQWRFISATGYPLTYYNEEYLQRNAAAVRKFWGPFVNACILCALKKYMEVGVDSLKVLQRTHPVSMVIEKVRELREAMDMAHDYDDYGEYCRAVRKRFRVKDCIHDPDSPWRCIVHDAREPSGF